MYARLKERKHGLWHLEFCWSTAGHGFEKLAAVDIFLKFKESKEHFQFKLWYVDYDMCIMSTEKC